MRLSVDFIRLDCVGSEMALCSHFGWFFLLSFLADWPPFFQLHCHRHDDRKTTKGSNHTCRCVLQSQVASVVEFFRRRQNQKPIPLRSSSPWESPWRVAKQSFFLGTGIISCDASSSYYLFFWFIYSLSFLTIVCSYHSWRRELRPRSPRLKTNVPLTLIGIRRKFCNRPIMLSIGGSTCGTRLSVCILTTNVISNSLKALTSTSLRKVR